MVNTLKKSYISDINMKELVVVLFISSVILRGIIATIFSEYSVFYDELLHLKLAKGISEGQGIYFRGAELNYKEILYSLIISPAFLVSSNMEIVHIFIMWINSVLMSSAIRDMYNSRHNFFSQL